MRFLVLHVVADVLGLLLWMWLANAHQRPKQDLRVYYLEAKLRFYSINIALEIPAAIAARTFGARFVQSRKKAAKLNIELRP